MASEIKFAVLIDADNISEKYIKIILDEISKEGTITYKRIYGDWTNPSLSSWKNVLLDHSILPVQQYSYTTGKNSTDSAMIIDAMDILYSDKVDGFCLVSSDSDFTRLAARLRESGMLVVGMGERKTPKPFIAACNRFKYLDVLALNEKRAAEEAAREQARQQQSERDKAAAGKSGKKGGRNQKKDEEVKELSELDIIKLAVKSIVEENADEDGWLSIGTIGSLLVKRYPDFDVRNFGFHRLTPFIESMDLFEIKSVRTSYSNSRQIYVMLK